SVRGGLVLAVVLAGALVLKMVSRGDQANTQARPLERLRPLTAPIESRGGPAFSPDGNRVAFVRRGVDRAETGIFVIETESGQTMQLTSNDGDCCPAWSPDGHFIALSRFANKRLAIYVVPSDAAGRKQEAERMEAARKLTANATGYVQFGSGNGERKLDIK